MSAIQDSKNGEVPASPSSSPTKSSPKSSPTKKDIDVATQALNHFAQGKRHLLVSDVNSAVNSLQEACRLLAEHYGETAFECADAYYYYGRALLEMARIENGVLGNALDGVPEGEDADNSQVEDPEKMTEDERDLVSEAVGEALEENFKENEKVKSTKNGVEASAKEMDAEEMELFVSKSGEKVEDSNNKLNNSVEPKEKTKECVVEALQTEKNNLKKSEKPTSAENSEESKSAEETKSAAQSKETKCAVESKETKSEVTESAEQSEVTKSAEKSEVTKSAEKSEVTKSAEKSEEKKSAEKSEETKSAEKSEETKSAEKSEEIKSAEKSEETKTAEKSEETKYAEKSEVPKTVEKSEEAKCAEKSKESKPSEKSVESKCAENSEETPMDTSESSPKETSEDNKENLDAAFDKKATEKTTKSILKESSNQKEEKLCSELNKDETMDVESITKKEEGSTESEGECDGKDGEDENKEDAADEENGEGEDETEAEESQEEPEGDQTEEDEDVSNLQLSWEMFELSKVIFLKQEVVNQQKVSQVYLKLGEVGLESENYSQSIEDFTSCLEIQKKTLQPDDRCLAETYYQLGVAHSFSDDFDKAMDNFSAAANVIETKISNLKNKIKEKENWTEEQKHKAVTEQEDPFYTEQGEIDELDKLLPEIKEKLVDMEEMKKDTKEKLEKVKEATFASVLGGSRSAGTSSGEASTSEGFSGGFSEATKESSVNKIEAKPTSNISHLIRKKRKPEEEAEKEDLKKAKGDAEVKKVSAVNGTSKLEKMDTDSVTVEKEEDKVKVVAPVDDKMECSTTA